MIYIIVLKEFSESLKSKNETKTIKNKRKRNINIDQILLGPLTTDTAFLKKIVDNPKLVIKKKDAFGEDLPFGCCQDEVKLLDKLQFRLIQILHDS